MTPNRRRKIVLILIKDDLTNTRLLEGLFQIGLDADEYCLDLSSVIFELMDLGRSTKRNERVFEGYVERTKEVMAINVSKDQKQLADLTLRIYDYLQAASTKPVKK